MASLLTARNLPGIGDADPPEDEDWPECSTCDGYGTVEKFTCSACLRDGCAEHGMTGEFACPDCNGTGYEPNEPDPDVGLDWMP